jgi:hypothetical protein
LAGIVGERRLGDAGRDGLGPLRAGDRTSGRFVTFRDAIDGAVKAMLREKPQILKA